VLHKDFIIDEYQIVESRAYRADAVLLITAALQQKQLSGLKAAAERLGMDALVEIHDEKELEMAVAVEAHMIGINNRNLKTLQISLAVTERLAPMVPRRLGDQR